MALAGLDDLLDCFVDEDEEPKMVLAQPSSASCSGSATVLNDMLPQPIASVNREVEEMTDARLRAPRTQRRCGAFSQMCKTASIEADSSYSISSCVEPREDEKLEALRPPLETEADRNELFASRASCARSSGRVLQGSQLSLSKIIKDVTGHDHREILQQELPDNVPIFGHAPMQLAKDGQIGWGKDSRCGGKKASEHKAAMNGQALIPWERRIYSDRVLSGRAEQASSKFISASQMQDLQGQSRTSANKPQTSSRRKPL
mmetsp:Transcript_30840/g.48070  ORF Transcript_30840/g.48070 Transcript_30840/m.48070 type:complete len:260 (-) Transcript_30840:10-789(-)